MKSTIAEVKKVKTTAPTKPSNTVTSIAADKTIASGKQAAETTSFTATKPTKSLKTVAPLTTAKILTTASRRENKGVSNVLLVNATTAKTASPERDLEKTSDESLATKVTLLEGDISSNEQTETASGARLVDDNPESFTSSPLLLEQVAIEPRSTTTVNPEKLELSNTQEQLVMVNPATTKAALQLSATEDDITSVSSTVIPTKTSTFKSLLPETAEATQQLPIDSSAAPQTCVVGTSIELTGIPVHIKNQTLTTCHESLSCLTSELALRLGGLDQAVQTVNFGYGKCVKDCYGITCDDISAIAVTESFEVAPVIEHCSIKCDGEATFASIQLEKSSSTGVADSGVESTEAAITFTDPISLNSGQGPLTNFEENEELEMDEEDETVLVIDSSQASGPSNLQADTTTTETITTTARLSTTASRLVLERRFCEKVPFLERCNLNELRNRVWLCTTAFFNNLPFQSKKLCRSNIQHLESCIEGMFSSCTKINDSSPVMYSFNSSLEMAKEAFFRLNPFFLRPNFNIFCSKDNPSANVSQVELMRLNRSDLILDSSTFSCNLEAALNLEEAMVNFYELAPTAHDLSAFCRTYEEYKYMMKRALRACPSVIRRLLPSTDDMTQILGDSSYLSVLANKQVDFIDNLMIPRCISSNIIRKESSRNVQAQPFALAPNSEGCYKYILDCMFLLDGSGSMQLDEFTTLVDFIKNVSSYFDLQENNFGVMQYSHFFQTKKMTEQRYLQTAISIGEYDNLFDFNVAADGIKHQGYTTYTAHAIKKAVEIDFVETGRFLNPCTRKAIVVVTDGKASDHRELSTEANSGRRKGFTFFAVGVARARKKELEQIAFGEGEKRGTYIAKKFSDLNKLVLPLKNDLFNLLSIEDLQFD